MKTIQINLYKFSELSDAAKKRVREKFSDYFPFECDLLTEDFREILADKFGICGDIQIDWSLSYCQGDGVAFYGKPDADKLLEKHEELRKLLQEYPKGDYDPSLWVEIRNCSTHYHHYNTMQVSCDVEDVNREQSCRELDDKVYIFLVQLFRGASKYLEKIGYESIEAHNSESNMNECLEGLGEEFLESGRFYYE